MNRTALEEVNVCVADIKWQAVHSQDGKVRAIFVYLHAMPVWYSACMSIMC